MLVLQRVSLIAVALGLPGVLAVMLLRIPEQLQAWFLRYHERHPLQTRLNPAMEFNRSPACVTYLRRFSLALAIFDALPILLFLWSVLDHLLRSSPAA